MLLKHFHKTILSISITFSYLSGKGSSNNRFYFAFCLSSRICFLFLYVSSILRYEEDNPESISVKRIEFSHFSGILNYIDLEIYVENTHVPMPLPLSKFCQKFGISDAPWNKTSCSTSFTVPCRLNRLFCLLWSNLRLLWPNKKTLKIHARPLVFGLQIDFDWNIKWSF